MASQIQCPTSQNLWEAVLADSRLPQDLNFEFSFLQAELLVEAQVFESLAEAG